MERNGIRIKDSIIIYVSSKNNYQMLENEVLQNINTENYELINIDDNSTQIQKSYGEKICKENNIIYLDNNGCGVQMATQTLVEFVLNFRPKCKWLICFQHDNWPITENFFSKLDKLIDSGFMDEFGACGFHILDDGDFFNNHRTTFSGKAVDVGYLGIAHLSVKDNWMRNICPKRIDLNWNQWMMPFTIEIPVWAIVGINLKKWVKYINPSHEYQFHLWYPDVAMQFLYNNINTIILPELYCFNNQRLKEKYKMHWNSAVGSQEGQVDFFGEYGPHLRAFKNRWGWDYENVQLTEQNLIKYNDTLISKYYHHNLKSGPLVNFKNIKY